MSRVQASVLWFKHSLAWSNSPQSWIERIAGTLVLLAAVGLILGAGTGRIGPWSTLVLTLLFITTVAVLSRIGWLTVFGPVLFYDMLVTARRGRYFLVRFLYSVLLLAVLATVWANVQPFGRTSARDQAAQIGMMYFEWFTVVQLIAVVLLTPAYVAGSVTEEKERKTLEFLLATDLRNREIILSKFGSRLGNLTLFLLTGLPILSFLQFLGGVDPDLVLGGFAATALTAVGLASMSILNSVIYKRSRDAIAITYLMVITYLAIATVLFGFKQGPFSVFSDPELTVAMIAATIPATLGVGAVFVLLAVSSKPIRDSITATGFAISSVVTWFLVMVLLYCYEWTGPFRWVLDAIGIGGSLPTLGDAVDWLNAGNILVVLFFRVARAGATGSLATVVPTVLWEYFLFHGALCLVCVGWSVARLRSLALMQSYGKTDKLRWHQRYRPTVGNLPVLWKELVVEGSLRLNWFAWIAVMLLVLLTVGIGVWIVAWFFWVAFFEPNMWHGGLSEVMNVWVRIAGTGVGLILLIGVAVRASTTIRNERDRDTFDALITTPLPSNQVLLGKFAGCLFSVRLGWFWLGAILGLGVVTGGLHVLALPIFLGAWVIYAVVFAMIGLWFSMVCRSSMRSTVYTMLTTIGVSVGHWMIWMCCGPLFIFLEMNRGLGHPAEYLGKFQLGMTPPFVLGFLAYSQDSLSREFNHSDGMQFLGFSLLGLFLWTMAGLMLWFVLIVPKFRQLTRRDQSSSEME
jgi:ABC-type transport system involved in multi-copper enzyme maturation permease subunit